MRYSLAGLLLSAILFVPALLPAQSAEARLEALGPATRIGAFEGTETEVIGLVGDGYVGSDRIALVDPRLQQLRIYDLDGTLLHHTGRGGRGPGEFYVLRAVTLLDGRDPVIFDQGNRRLSFYSAQLELERDLSVPGLFSDMCSIGDRLFLQGVHDDHTIHEVSVDDGTILRSFGDLPAVSVSASRPLEQSALRNQAEAALICDGDNSQIIEVPHNTPYVRAYSLDGTLKWEAQLEDFRAVRPQITDRGSLVLVPDPDTNSQHFLAAASLFDAETLAVQHSVIDFENREIDEGTLHTWLLDRTRGTTVERVDTLPRLLHYSDGVRLFGSNLPWPQLGIVRSGPEG